MKKNNFLPALGYLLICGFLTLLGCAKSNIQMPKSLPPIVREYKHSTVYGGQVDMENTGVYIEAGDVYSVLATGRIDFWPSGAPPAYKYHDVRPEMGWPLMVRIGEHYKFNPFYNTNGITRISDQSGHIYLGYKNGPMTAFGRPLRPDYYTVNKGAFNVDIIVWEKPEWIKIIDFLSQMVLKDPGNKPIADAHQDAEKFGSIFIAEEKAKKEIAETETQISELKKEAQQEEKPEAKPSANEGQTTEGLPKEDKIAQL